MRSYMDYARCRAVRAKLALLKEETDATLGPVHSSMTVFEGFGADSAAERSKDFVKPGQVTMVRRI